MSTKSQVLKVIFALQGELMSSPRAFVRIVASFASVVDADVGDLEYELPHSGVS
jgi:hypothetical protein